MSIRLTILCFIFMGIVIVSLPPSVLADSRVDRLAELLQSSPSFRVRTQSALSLGRLGQRDTVSILVEALNDEHYAVRAAAAIALGRIGSSDAEQALSHVIADTDQRREVRELARHAWERIRQFASR